MEADHVVVAREGWQCAASADFEVLAYYARLSTLGGERVLLYRGKVRGRCIVCRQTAAQEHEISTTYARRQRASVAAAAADLARITAVPDGQHWTVSCWTLGICLQSAIGAPGL